MNTALQFGVGLDIESVTHTAETARLLENLGFDYVSAGEHVMFRRPTSLALPLLGVAAGATQCIRLATAIVLLPLHHPLLLAKEATTVDGASGGRLTLGIGVGGESPQEFEACEVPVKERGARSNEALTVLKKVWTEEDANFEGEFFRFRGVSLKPMPTQKPHPPIWVAGRKEAAMRRAVRFGTGWLPYLYSPGRYRTSVEFIEKIASEENRSLENFSFGITLQFATYPDRQKAKNIALEALQSRYTGDFTHLIDRYCVLGPPEECVLRLKEYVDAGARVIFLSWVCRPEDIDRNVKTVATEIIPGLRALCD